ncbi:MAG: GSCFA domain-containing protein, partial [Cypionkella sp.]
HWLKGDGIVDPFRPTIEPEPFSSVAEMHALRESHLEAVVEIFEKADVFVFTLGLTEAWLSKADGAAFPLCPGTAGGTYDETRHAFENLSSAKVRADMEEFIALAHKINPKLKLFLTVSPVPLMATASTSQVAVASSYSKAVLRAVAGELYDAHDFVDYFPSYEIISSSFMKGYYFEPDAREVSHHGVNHVMSVFFSQHKIPSRATPAQPPAIAADNPLSQSLSEAEERERVKCDEELLNAFSGTD